MLQDLEAVDLDFYNTLGWILNNDLETSGYEDTFTAEVDFFGRKDIIELKPGGAEIPLTNTNKKEWVDLKAQHIMTIAINAQLRSFCGGFWDIIPKASSFFQNNQSILRKLMHTFVSEIICYEPPFTASMHLSVPRPLFQLGSKLVLTQHKIFVEKHKIFVEKISAKVRYSNSFYSTQLCLQ